MNIEDTIAAIATPSGRGGIGVIRISGKQAPLKSVVQAILGSPQFDLKPRFAHYRKFHDLEHRVIDEGMVLYFPAPHSFTGEHVVELQGHGGPVVMDTLLQSILQQGIRLANPGEFTERAFLNDKIDLVQAEAVADLIDSASAQAARCAVRSLQGEFSKRIHRLVEKLIQLRTHTEAAIDFPEEEIDFLADSKISAQLEEIIEALAKLKKEASYGSIINEGIRLVIAGPPNAGKSSLLNCLSGTDSAIVTPVAGTTRDVLKEQILIDGLPINVVDTAGLRQTTEIVEQEGIKRAKKEMQNADAVLLVFDSSQSSVADMMKNLPEQQGLESIPVTYIENKIDLTNKPAQIKAIGSAHHILLSLKNSQGLDLLRQHIKNIAGFNANDGGQYTARRRHLDALDRAAASLGQAARQLQQGAGELMAEDLRQTQAALGEITGEFSSDDLLGRIFSSFCIGK